MEVEVGGRTLTMKVLFTQEEIHSRVKAIAASINETYPPGEPLVILVVLHGALLFAADLVRELQLPTQIESIRLKSYHGTTSTGEVQIIGTAPENLRDAHVLVVEDIVDTGRTLDFLLRRLREVGTKSVRVAALLDKPEAHVVPVKADYIGFSIGKNFVIGYGLDLDGKYRNLPFIAELS